MQLRKSERKKAKIRMALQAPSGAGKTMSALLIAMGMTGDWNKIAVIDTENNSSDLYAHLGDFNVLQLEAPFTPERYMKAIEACENAEMEVIIVDSISQEWEGMGGILNIHSNMTGNSFTNWGKLTPRHNAFVQRMLQSRCHIIGTIRSKQDYVLTENSKGKLQPEKVGLKGITRDGMDYEFTLVLELDLAHNATSTKDRTGLFMGNPPFTPTEETGKKILDWCNEGTDLPTIKKKIKACKTLEELTATYHQYISYYDDVEEDFKSRKAAITKLLNKKSKQNGTAVNQ